MKTAQKERNGIALVVVLSLMALLMVLGVAFSIYMRTERLAAGNFKNDVRCRVLLQAGLAKALADVDTYMVSSNLVYPNWLGDVMGSTQMIVSTRRGTNPSETNTQSFLSGEVAKFIPRSLWSEVSHATVCWQAISNVPGRFSYLVLNCSGLFDANVAGSNASLRGVGMSPTEIQISALPGWKPPPSGYDKFLGDRENVHLRYETLQEMGTLITNCLDPDVLLWPANFATYSRFPSGYLQGDMSSGVVIAAEGNLSGDVSAVSNREAAVKDAFVKSGIAPSQADFVFNNLLDYMDIDSVPRYLNSPCTEAVPMINEVDVFNQIEYLSSSTCVASVNIKVEWFYPFVKMSPFTYRLSNVVEIVQMGDAPTKFLPASTNYVEDLMFRANQDKGPDLYGLWEKDIQTTVVKIQPSDIDRQSKLKVRVGSQVLLVQGNAMTVVDSVPHPLVAANYMEITNLPITIESGHSEGDVVSVPCRVAECYDPRFNWDPNPDSEQWRYGGDALTSIGELNKVVTEYRTTATMGCEDYTSMYVADRTLLTVGELSYLLRGARSLDDAGDPNYPNIQDKWNTIKLYDDSRLFPIDRVLDHFYLGGQPTGVSTGKVNPNTAQGEVMAAVFQGMPIDKYPGQSDASTVGQSEPAEAFTLADAFVNSAWAGSFTNLSDIGHATNVFVGTVLEGRSAFEKESVFRNCAGLFSSRQNLFTILLAAQATDEVQLPAGDWRTTIRSASRAVAEVWRDPYPDAGGRHPYFVRFFKMLEE
jgi:hypothetical protein